MWNPFNREPNLKTLTKWRTELEHTHVGIYRGAYSKIFVVHIEPDDPNIPIMKAIHKVDYWFSRIPNRRTNYFNCWKPIVEEFNRIVTDPNNITNDEYKQWEIACNCM